MRLDACEPLTRTSPLDDEVLHRIKTVVEGEVELERVELERVDEQRLNFNFCFQKS